jgi:phosphatidylglycerol---prolipoprotein diacylglyceryl transferase
VTHWFESGELSERRTATVRFRGRLTGPRGDSSGRREFVQNESIDGIVAGSGPVSVSTEIYNLAAGDWDVTAELLDQRHRAAPAEGRAPWRRQKTLPRAAWSWKSWSLASAPFAPVATRWAPTVRLVPVPAVIPGSWIALVALGSAAGLGLQSLLLAQAGLPVVPALVLTAFAALAGLGAAKAWYIAMHPRSWRQSPGEGWAVDGFLVVLPLVVVAGLVVLELPIGRFVDASTPGLFVGVAIGRLGCFFTGCCAGRFSSSRWSVWSSDRRIGGRRVPTQLLESAAGLLIALATLALLLGTRRPFDGLIFIAALATYTLVRRTLLPLRAARQALFTYASSGSDRRRGALGTRGLD